MSILTITEAAKAAGVSKSTIYRRLKDGTLTVSNQPDGSKGVDTAELIRVFGELKLQPSENTSEIPSRYNAFQHWHKYCEKYPAFCQALATLGGALLGALIVWLTAFMQIQATLKSAEQIANQTKQTAQITLIRGLLEFYESRPNFKKVHATITQCEYKIPLSVDDKNKPGFLDWQDVNSFIGFIDALGFYWKQGILELDLIDHQFGALIREAYLDVDMKAYIEKLQTVAKEIEAGIEFYALAKKLIEMPKHAAHVELWKGHSCRNN